MLKLSFFIAQMPFSSNGTGTVLLVNRFDARAMYAEYLRHYDLLSSYRPSIGHA